MQKLEQYLSAEKSLIKAYINLIVPQRYLKITPAVTQRAASHTLFLNQNTSVHQQTDHGGAVSQWQQKARRGPPHMRQHQ